MARQSGPSHGVRKVHHRGACGGSSGIQLAILALLIKECAGHLGWYDPRGLTLSPRQE